MNSNPPITVIIATHNRCAALSRTLNRLRRLHPVRTDQIIVVDNASSDDTRTLLKRDFAEVELIANRRNLGSCAKALALPLVRSPLTLFLDDDSAPQPGSIERMVAHFESDPRLGAAGFRVRLPSGREESGAFGDVFVGCGVGFRTEALHHVGGLDPGLFMQAEEYDLAFRLTAGGWGVRTFDDLWVDHEKTPAARMSHRTLYYDTRNNLLLTWRYLPDAWADDFRHDWVHRYQWFAEMSGAQVAWARANRLASRIGPAQRRRFHQYQLSTADFESLIHLPIIEFEIRRLAACGITRVAFISLGKNILPFWKACRRERLEILAIGDDRFGQNEYAYRGVPVIPVASAFSLPADAFIVTDTSPARATALTWELARHSNHPIENWFARRPTADATSRALLHA